MEDDLILKGPDAAIDIPNFRKNISVIDILYKTLKNNGGSIAQIEADTGKSITFSEFLRRSCVIAANLRKYGITEGDTVFVCSDKCILAYCFFAAVIFTGATVALKETDLSKDDVQHIKICKPKLIFCSKEAHKLLIKEDVHKPIFFFPDGTSPQTGYNVFLEGNQDFKTYKVEDLKNHCPLILFTSGSTGPSKPVLVPNVSLQRYGYSFNPCDEKAERFMVIAPFGWISSVVIFLSSVLRNYTMVLSVPDPVLHLQRTQHYQVDTWMASPPTLLGMVNVPNLSSYNLSSMKTILTGGGPLNMHLKKTVLEKICGDNISLELSYGSTEAGIFSTFKGVDPETIRTTSSSGKISSGVQLRVANENGRSVGPGIEGEFRVKTDSMMTKYIGFPEATNNAFDSEGWYCTGDYGYYDKDGFIYPLGRLSDLIHYKGFKVCMTHVEGLLATHPAVLDAVVAARPNPIDNQHPAAFVITKPNMTVTAEDIQRYIDDQVDDIYKLRGGVHFVDHIPKVLSGKALRYKLQEKFHE